MIKEVQYAVRGLCPFPRLEERSCEGSGSETGQVLTLTRMLRFSAIGLSPALRSMAAMST